MGNGLGLPADFSELGPRQRDLIEVIYKQGGATVRELHCLINDPPKSIYGLRTLLNRMTERGILRKRRSGRHSEVCYVLANADPQVCLRAFNRIAMQHFNGSKSRAAQVLMKLAEQEARAENTNLPVASKGMRAA